MNKMLLYKLNPVIKFRWEKDTILLNTLLPFNKTAGNILEMFKDGPKSFQKILNTVSSKYKNDNLEQITKDVESLFEQLIKYNILMNANDDETVEKNNLRGMSWNFAEIIKRVYKNQLSAPARVSCKITSKCNAKCLHCYASDPEEGDELTFDEWKRFFDYLAEIGVFSVNFTGGDPLCRKEIVELVEYCHYKGLSVTIVTNGLALNRDIASSLKKAGVRAIIQSLDGACAETHDKFRQVKGLYNKVLENIELLKELNIPTAILTTINKLNIDEIEKIIDIVEQKGVKIISLMRFIDSGSGDRNRYLMPSLEDYMELLPKLYKRMNQSSKIKVLFPDVPAKCYEKTIGLNAYQKIKQNGFIAPCSAGITTIAISSTGGIKVCDISENYFIGNIRSDKLQDVWLNSPILNTIRNVSKTAEEFCSECDSLNSICWSGCRAFDYQVSSCTTKKQYGCDSICEDCYEKLVNQ